MRQLLTVTTSAADLHLLTIDEMRAAAGVSDGSQDAALQAMSLKVASSIATECNVSIGIGAEPTLKKERLTETFRLGLDGLVKPYRSLFLSRRHNIQIISVTVDGILYDPESYEADPETGRFYRLSNDLQIDWSGRKIVVVYDAGFTTIPADLKMAATDFFRMTWLEKSRDPAKKREEVDIPGVAHTVTDYWVGAIPGQGSESAVPTIVAGQLQRYRNVVI